jgi:3-hydroxyisobutyrate dehydrogenase-like beta-hydroxyacid dehydrogenase
MMRVAFLGLGIMGSRMAANLLKANYPVSVWNRTPGKDLDLVQAGAVRAANPAACAAGADVVVSMLSTPEVVEQTALSHDGFLAVLQPGAFWIDSSTVNPSFSKRMAGECAARGLHFLDAPVTGSKEAAEKGQLVFLVGGSTGDLEAVRPLLEKMSKAIVHVGDSGMGSSLKVVNNMLAAQAGLAFAETLVLGESLGISHERLLDFFLGGPIASPLLNGKRAKYESLNFDPDFPLQWMQKDLQLAALTAYENRVAIPSANLAKEIYQLAARFGLADADFTAIYQYLSMKR